MTDFSWIVLIVAGSAALAVLCYGLLVPILAGLPWRPTSFRRIRRALEMAQVRPGEAVYDLGAGDGRVLVIAARTFHARAVGFEISPLGCLLGRVSAMIYRVSGQVTIRQADFYKADLRGADVVFAYMTSMQVARLRPHLENQLKPGARLVTISFDMDGWEPQALERDDLIFLYKMPPSPGNVETFLAKNL